MGVLGGQSNAAGQGSAVMLLFFGEQQGVMGLKCQKLAPLELLGGTPHASQAVAALYLDRGPEGVLGLPYHEGRGGDDGNVHEQRMPFPVRAIQVDGGSEFQATFETECQRRCIRPFVLPPRSPKLNGQVERAHRTHTEEFYEIIDLPDTILELNRLLQDWERVYSAIRSHQALGYRTPLQAVLQFRQQEVT